MASNRKGALLVLISAFWFSCMSILIKHLGHTYSAYQVAFLRTALSLIPLTLLMRHKNLTLYSPRWKLLSMRGTWGLAGMLCYYWTLAHIPLAEAVMLNYSAPVFAVIFAASFLDEKITTVTLWCIALALCGLWLILEPAFTGPATGYLVGLAGGIGAGAAFAMVKALTRQEPSLRIVWYFAASGAILTLMPAIAHWRQPDGFETLLLILVSLSGLLAQMFLTWGFERASVSSASPSTLATVIITAIAGWVFWNELPGPKALLGMCAVAAAIVLLAFDRPTKKAHL